MVKVPVETKIIRQHFKKTQEKAGTFQEYIRKQTYPLFDDICRIIVGYLFN